MFKTYFEMYHYWILAFLFIKDFVLRFGLGFYFGSLGHTWQCRGAATALHLGVTPGGTWGTIWVTGDPRMVNFKGKTLPPALSFWPVLLSLYCCSRLMAESWLWNVLYWAGSCLHLWVPSQGCWGAGSWDLSVTRAPVFLPRRPCSSATMESGATPVEGPWWPTTGFWQLLTASGNFESPSSVLIWPVFRSKNWSSNCLNYSCKYPLAWQRNQHWLIYSSFYWLTCGWLSKANWIIL